MIRIITQKAVLVRSLITDSPGPQTDCYFRRYKPRPTRTKSPVYPPGFPERCFGRNVPAQSMPSSGLTPSGLNSRGSRPVRTASLILRIVSPSISPPSGRLYVAHFSQNNLIVTLTRALCAGCPRSCGKPCRSRFSLRFSAQVARNARRVKGMDKSQTEKWARTGTRKGREQPHRFRGPGPFRLRGSLPPHSADASPSVMSASQTRTSVGTVYLEPCG